jgi:hypothetical protein
MDLQPLPTLEVNDQFRSSHNCVHIAVADYTTFERRERENAVYCSK